MAIEIKKGFGGWSFYDSTNKVQSAKKYKSNAVDIEEFKKYVEKMRPGVTPSVTLYDELFKAYNLENTITTNVTEYITGVVRDKGSINVTEFSNKLEELFKTEHVEVEGKGKTAKTVSTSLNELLVDPREISAFYHKFINVTASILNAELEKAGANNDRDTMVKIADIMPDVSEAVQLTINKHCITLLNELIKNLEEKIEKNTDDFTSSSDIKVLHEKKLEELKKIYDRYVRFLPPEWKEEIEASLNKTPEELFTDELNTLLDTYDDNTKTVAEQKAKIEKLANEIRDKIKDEEDKEKAIDECLAKILQYYAAKEITKKGSARKGRLIARTLERKLRALLKIEESEAEKRYPQPGA